MFKVLLLIAASIYLTGCTAHIRESEFILQDKVTTDFNQTDLEKWQNSFPEHKLKTLEMVTNDKSATLKGLLFDNPNSQDVIFYIPGNGMKISDSAVKLFKKLVKLETDIVIFDRRGLGGSDGQATIANLISDSLEKIQFLRNSLNIEKLIIHGYSLGSFVAGELAKREKIDALVLQGAATNVDDWIDEKMPWYAKLFVSVKKDAAFDTIDNKTIVSQHYDGPLFIIGAENDKKVPAKFSKILFNVSTSENKKLMVVKGANHTSMLDNIDAIMIYKKFLKSIDNSPLSEGLQKYDYLYNRIR